MPFLWCRQTLLQTSGGELSPVYVITLFTIVMSVGWLVGLNSLASAGRQLSPALCSAEQPHSEAVHSREFPESKRVSGHVPD